MFVFAIVLFIIAALAFVGAQFAPVAGTSDVKRPRRFVRLIASGALALAVLFTLIASIQVVSTKNVGIEVAFGRVDGHLSNGLHFTAPWVSVTEMNAAIQTDSFTNAQCIEVRIANQQTACVHVSIRWRIEPGAADSLFQNYRTFDQVRDSLVTRELRAALNNQLTNYNPLNSIQVSATPAANYVGNPSLTEIAGKVTAQMRSEIGSDINVINTIIPFMSFDSATQARLNQLQQQEAKTRIAIAAQQTAQQQAIANQSLAASVNNSPGVLQAQCLDNQEQIIKNGDNPLFSCLPGTGGSTNVVVAPSGLAAK